MKMAPAAVLTLVASAALAATACGKKQSGHGEAAPKPQVTPNAPAENPGATDPAPSDGTASGGTGPASSAPTGGTSPGGAGTGGGAPADGAATASGNAIPLAAAVKYLAVPSAAEGCVATAGGALKDLLPHPGGLAAGEQLVYALDDSPYLSGAQILKIQLNAAGAAAQLIAIEAQPAVVQAAIARLQKGESLSLARDAACAPDASDKAAVLRISALTLTPDAELGAATATTLALESTRSGPAVGATYSYYADSTSWGLYFQSTVDDATVNALPATLKWNIFNRETLAYIGAWQDTPRASLQAADLGVTDAAALKRLLPRQGVIDLVFDAGARRFILPLGELCRKYEALFYDGTNAGKKCYELKDSDLP